MSAASDTIYHRNAPLPRQRRFPSMRRSIRTMPSTPLNRHQATLTQLDFVDSPSSSSRGAIDDTFSRDDDQGEDFADPRPTKKQKKRRTQPKKDLNQGTLTQNWRTMQFARDSDDDDDQDGDFTTIENGTPPRAILGAETLCHTARFTSAFGDEDEREEVDEHLPDVGFVDPAPCQAAATSNRSRSARNATPISEEHSHQTPRRVRIAEVPSSQTPSSIKLAAHGSKPANSEQRSPLKERSTNLLPENKMQSIAPLYGKREDSEGPAMADEEKHPERSKDVLIDDPHRKSDLAHTPGKDIRSNALTLTRCTTIQDSEEGNHQMSPFAKRIRKFTRTTTIQESEDGDQQPSPISKPLRVFSRAMAVQESDNECEPGHLEAQVEFERSDDNDDDDNGMFTYQTMPYQDTFDPVAAALDRDAARFGLSVTQLLTQPHSSRDFGDGVGSLRDETDLVDTKTPPPSRFRASVFKSEKTAELDEDDGNNCDLYQTVVGEPQRVISSQPAERLSTLQPPQDAGSHGGHVVELGDRDQETNEPEFVASSQPEERSTDAARWNDGLLPAPHEEACDNIAQSMLVNFQAPPLPTSLQTQQPHPSQISTFVPSQPSQGNFADADPPSSPCRTTAPMKFPDTISSSPLTLPPWTAEELAARNDMETQGSLTEFSLPRPPLWSSNTGSSLW